MRIKGTGDFPQSMKISMEKEDGIYYLKIIEKHPSMERLFGSSDVSIHIDPEIIKEFNLCK